MADEFNLTDYAENTFIVESLKTRLHRYESSCDSDLFLTSCDIQNSNASEQKLFTSAYCSVKPCKNRFGESIVVRPYNIVRHGIKVIDKFVDDENPGIPIRQSEKKALLKLLDFIASLTIKYGVELKVTTQVTGTEELKTAIEKHMSKLKGTPVEIFVLDLLPDSQIVNFMISSDGTQSQRDVEKRLKDALKEGKLCGSDFTVSPDVYKFKVLEKEKMITYQKGQSKASWAIQLAEHLLLPLAVGNKYMLDNQYSKELTCIQDKYYCPCELEEHQMTGNFGNTTFGCVEGWHGRAGIIFEEIPVAVVLDEEKDDSDGSDDYDSLTELKSKKGFSNDKEDKVLAQTIVFSFLQRKKIRDKSGPSEAKKAKKTASDCASSNKTIKNEVCLVPSLAFSEDYLYIVYYDSENDILLKSTKINLQHLFDHGSHMILQLWLVLNFSCLEIPPELLSHKANFFDSAGDLIDEYRNNVQKPLPYQRSVADNSLICPYYVCESKGHKPIPEHEYAERFRCFKRSLND